MSPVTIAVFGTASTFHLAERATVRLLSRFESRSRETAVSATTALMAQLQAGVRALSDSGAVTWWNADSVFASSFQRYVKDSQVTETLEYAAAGMRVKFRDFAALGRWVAEVSAEPGATVSGIEWALTDAVRQELERRVRIEAVRDAQARAEAYGRALGAEEPPILVALYEQGLRPHEGSARPTAFSAGMRAAPAARGAGEPLELKPGDLEVSASITADFRLDLPAA